MTELTVLVHLTDGTMRTYGCAMSVEVNTDLSELVIVPEVDVLTIDDVARIEIVVNR